MLFFRVSLPEKCPPPSSSSRLLSWTGRHSFYTAMVALPPLNDKPEASGSRPLIRAACSIYGTEYRVTNFKPNRFYLPENTNRRLIDQAIADKKATALLGIKADGSYVVKDLLIDHQNWKVWLSASTDTTNL